MNRETHSRPYLHCSAHLLPDQPVDAAAVVGCLLDRAFGLLPRMRGIHSEQAVSYCRFSSDSDVYLYLSPRGYVCCGCLLADEEAFATPCDATAHLKRHIEAGHQVPPSAIEKLCAECGAGWPLAKSSGTTGEPMTNLETVAAQRDEATTKLRAMARELEAANVEIARLRAEATVAAGPPHGALLAVAPIPVKAEDGFVAETFEPTASAAPPKAKRPGIFGSRKP